MWRYEELELRYGLSRNVDITKSKVVVKLMHNNKETLRTRFVELLNTIDSDSWNQTFPLSETLSVEPIMFDGTTYSIEVILNTRLQ